MTGGSVIYLPASPSGGTWRNTIAITSFSVYSFLDMFGFVRGIYELLKILGYAFAAFFTKKFYFNFSILSNLRDNPMVNYENFDNKEWNY